MRLPKEQLETLADFGIDEAQAESIAKALQGAAVDPFVGLITKDAYEKLTLGELASCPFSGGGMPLYKYYPDRIDPKTGCNYSRQALRGSTVHLSKPQSFNDPFDCLPGVDDERLVSHIIADLSGYLGLEVSEGASSSELAQSMSDALNAAGSLELPRLIPPDGDAHTLRKQLDYLNIVLNSRAKGSLCRHDVLNVAEQRKNILLEGIRNCRIACFSSSARDLHMWAHYANGHQGFCVEYETSLPTLAGLGYDLDWANLIGQNMFKVFYLQGRPDNTDLAIGLLDGPTEDLATKLYARILCAKGFNWVFEGEHRLILQDASMPDDFPFLPARKVLLGANMSPDAEREVTSICRELKILVMKARVSEKHYGLTEWPLK